MVRLALAPCRGVTFKVTLACNFTEVRLAAMAVCDFLSEQGMHEEEVAACEIALMEACNNAVQYAIEQEKATPIEVLATCNGSKVELEVRDHTCGFDWPVTADLPAAESESGRGLFLIQSLMDQTSYLHGRGGNRLVMCKTRCFERHRQTSLPPTGLEDARQRLIEAEQVIGSMAKELCFRSESLTALLRCTEELGKSLNFEEFSRRLLNDLIHITSADWFVFRIIPKNDPQLVVFVTSVALPEMRPLTLPVMGRPFNSVEMKAAVSRREVWYDSNKPLEADDPLTALGPDTSGVVWPVCSGETLIGTLTIGRCFAHMPLTPVQLEVLRAFADFLAIQANNLRMQEMQVTARLVSRELEIARDIQRALLPKSLPQIRQFGLAGYCESASRVGGDFYDALQISDTSVLLLVADVMGNGVPAAMFAAILRSQLRAIPEWSHNPAEMITRMNRQLYDELSQVDMFITAQLAVVDLKRRQITMANAGHCPILLVTEEAKEIQAISPEGMPLGVLPTAVFGEQKIRLGKRCRILIYTDGLTDARNAAGEQFGEKRLRQWLSSTLQRDRTAEQFKAELVAELAGFQGEELLRDDQSFLLLVEEGQADEVMLGEGAAREEKPAIRSRFKFTRPPRNCGERLVLC